MAGPGVELFTSFSLGSHSPQKLKQRWVTQLFIGDGKNYTVLKISRKFPVLGPVQTPNFS